MVLILPPNLELRIDYLHQFCDVEWFERDQIAHERLYNVAWAICWAPADLILYELLDVGDQDPTHFCLVHVCVPPDKLLFFISSISIIYGTIWCTTSAKSVHFLWSTMVATLT